MSIHALHSPSGAERRRICAGQLAACQGELNENSFWAAEGTAYHYVSNRVLERIASHGTGTGTECADWIGMYVHVTPETCYAGLPDKQPGDEYVFKVDDYNAGRAQVFVDAMLRRKGVSANVRQLYEVRLDTSEVIGIPGQGGTGDCVTLDFDNLTIFVDDLKFGKGKQVFASWTREDGVKWPNDQCAEYGAAALRMFRCLAPWKKVVVGIHQPRMPGGFEDEFEMTIEFLDQWVTQICAPYEQKAHKLLTASPEEILANLKPSKEGCTFCPIDGKCKAQIKDALAAFPVIQTPDGLNTAKSAMWIATDAEFLKVLELADRYSDFWGSVYGEGLRRSQAGSNFPGFKVVIGGKGHRKLDEDATLPPVFDDGAQVAPAAKVSELLVAELGSEAYAPPEFKTASKLDDFLKKVRGIPKDVVAQRKALWQRLQAAITQPDGKPTLVREGDTRPPVTRITGVNEFEVLPNQ